MIKLAVAAEYNSNSVDSDRLPQGIPATPMTGVEAPLLRSYNLRLAGKLQRLLVSLQLIFRINFLKSLSAICDVKGQLWP